MEKILFRVMTLVLKTISKGWKLTFFDSMNLVPPIILKHQKLHFFMKKDKFDAIDTFLKGTFHILRNHL